MMRLSLFCFSFMSRNNPSAHVALTIASVIQHHHSSALAWLRQSRKHFPPSSEHWSFLFNHDFDSLHKMLICGTYNFSAAPIVTKANGEKVALWCSSDAYVMKLLSLALTPVLPVHPLCSHTKGHKTRTILHRLDVQTRSGDYPFVCRTDIKGYYANINKHQLLEKLSQHIRCPIIMNLLGQFLFYLVEEGGDFYESKQGISRGSALSPLLGAFLLYDLDRSFENHPGIQYVRYMDDFVILCKTRHKLRKTVRLLNQWLERFGFIQHPDKTFIGRVEKGFDWLGRWFTLAGLVGPSPRAISNFANKLRQLYEQARKRPSLREGLSYRVQQYARRWNQWQGPTPSTWRCSNAASHALPPARHHNSQCS
ncbi:RNA-directed DNA polymerase [Vibrio crassostreae]|nr:RNA-directed DNA polymerase [Vibrio crassostreae]CAK2276109.1 RNA-directed DNA polymerase [Vibrio crassostreae]CAK2412860.1 RNA-directed DNA polymerase [Vibrio crassostreae]CAK2645825.1 RNA-directed DNA polymerase [Vibrio crassostreae]